MGILDIKNGWPLVSASGNRTGSAIDCRNAANYGLLSWFCAGNSAIFDVKAGPNASLMMSALAVTATAGASGMLQVSAFYPFVRVDARSIYSAAGGSAVLSVNWSPGYK